MCAQRARVRVRVRERDGDNAPGFGCFHGRVVSLTEQGAGATPPAQKKPGAHGTVLLGEPRGHEMPGEQAPHVRRDVE